MPKRFSFARRSYKREPFAITFESNYYSSKQAPLTQSVIKLKSSGAESGLPRTLARIAQLILFVFQGTHFSSLVNRAVFGQHAYH